MGKRRGADPGKHAEYLRKKAEKEKRKRERKNPAAERTESKAEEEEPDLLPDPDALPPGMVAWRLSSQHWVVRSMHVICVVLLLYKSVAVCDHTGEREQCRVTDNLSTTSMLVGGVYMLLLLIMSFMPWYESTVVVWTLFPVWGFLSLNAGLALLGRTQPLSQPLLSRGALAPGSLVACYLPVASLGAYVLVNTRRVSLFLYEWLLVWTDGEARCNRVFQFSGGLALFLVWWQALRPVSASGPAGVDLDHWPGWGTLLLMNLVSAYLLWWVVRRPCARGLGQIRWLAYGTRGVFLRASAHGAEVCVLH